MKYKLVTIVRKLLATLLILFVLFYIIYTSALFVQILLFKILISPTPQVLIISTTVFIVTAFLWALLAKKRNLLKSAKFVPFTILTSALIATFCIVFTLTIQPPAQITPIAKINPRIKVTTYNRLYENPDIDTPASYMKSIGSDIISLQEVNTPDYTKTFANKTGLQHYIQAPDNDTGLISRWPITRSKILQNGSKQVIRAEMATDKGKVIVYAVHITPPFTESMYKEGLAELQQLGDWIAKEAEPVIVAGDFNTTIYSPEMRSFTDKVSQNISPTTEQRWPQCNWYGHGKLQCLRIDFVFIPTNSPFLGSEISPDLGSDHRAVTVQFSL